MTHHLAAEILDRFGRRVVEASSPQGRFADGAAEIDGRKVMATKAMGKHLFVRFGGANWLHVHLGIYGKFTFGDGPTPEPVGQIRLRLVTRNSWADLRGPNRCELINPEEKDLVEARLGDDPLREDATGERAWNKISRSRSPIATLLMDQAVTAGVGNIFRAELLFRAKVNPVTPGREITREQWDEMWADLAFLMQYALVHGRIDTVRPEHEPEAMGRAPRVDDHGGEVYVYRRAGQPCHVCGDTVRHSDHAGRNLFWCPTCQSP